MGNWMPVCAIIGEIARLAVVRNHLGLHPGGMHEAHEHVATQARALELALERCRPSVAGGAMKDGEEEEEVVVEVEEMAGGGRASSSALSWKPGEAGLDLDLPLYQLAAFRCFVLVAKLYLKQVVLRQYVSVFSLSFLSSRPVFFFTSICT